jgi:hypothetical protein
MGEMAEAKMSTGVVMNLLLAAGMLAKALAHCSLLGCVSY